MRSVNGKFIVFNIRPDLCIRHESSALIAVGKKSIQLFGIFFVVRQQKTHGDIYASIQEKIILFVSFFGFVYFFGRGFDYSRDTIYLVS